MGQACTIADLAAQDAIAPEHVAAALQVVLTTARATLLGTSFPTAPRC